MGVVVKYAVYIAVFILVLAGVYVSGYLAGKSNARIEYIEKQVEVVKYVEKAKSNIYSKPNAGRDDLLKLMHANKL